MNKLYLLPISLILLNPGFAEENLANTFFSEVKIVSVDASQEGKIDIALLHPQTKKEIAALEIDPQLVEELKEEISALLQKNPEDQASEQEIADAENDPQQQPQGQQGTHVRRYPAQSPKAAPKAQGDRANAEEGRQQERRSPMNRQHSQAEKPHSRPQQQPQQTQPAKPLKTNPNTVDADNQNQRARARPQQAPSMQEDTTTADAEFEQPVQQQGMRKNTPEAYAPSANSSAEPEQSSSPRSGDGQRKVVQQKSNDQMYYPTDQSNQQRQMNQQGGQANQQKQKNHQGQMGTTQNAPKKRMMVNTPARPMVQDGYDLWIVGDALLWQAVEENLTYVYSGHADRKTMHTVDFSWDWGFRLGAGYNTPRDGWDIDFYWTHMHNTAHAHRGSDTALFQVWTVTDHTLSPVTDAKARWRVYLDQLDLDIGRQFYVGRRLTIRPFVGARSAWIYQKYSVDVLGTSVSAAVKQDAKMKSRFWGFGFAAGLDSDWKLGWGISMYGEADMSVLLGFFDVDQKGTQSFPIWSQNKSFRVGRAIMDLGMGLKWARLFSHDSLGITLKAGYEYHLYLDQNQFLLSNGSSTLELFNPVNGDLVYQGVIGSIQLDF